MREIKIKNKIIKGQCSNEGCNHPTKGKLCSTCRSRKSRLNDPVRYSFNNIKNRAKQRNKPFTITIEFFREWCYKYKYIQNKGTTSEAYTVDRKIEEEGYTNENIQPMKKGANVKKYLNYDYARKKALVSEEIINPEDIF